MFIVPIKATSLKSSVTLRMKGSKTPRFLARLLVLVFSILQFSHRRLGMCYSEQGLLLSTLTRESCLPQRSRKNVRQCLSFNRQNRLLPKVALSLASPPKQTLLSATQKEMSLPKPNSKPVIPWLLELWGIFLLLVSLLIASVLLLVLLLNRTMYQRLRGMYLLTKAALRPGISKH